MLETRPMAKPSLRPRSEAVEMMPNHAGATPAGSPSTPVDVRHLLAPARPGLIQVEAKMKSVDSSLFAPLASAFVDLIGSGGKRLRPALALMAGEFNGTLQGKPEYARVIALASSVEMLHTATLVHDDVIDDALLRRGAPTLNASWGKGSTVLAGNYMFGRAAFFAAETDSLRVIRIFSDTLKVIVQGELHQLFARNNYQQEKDSYYQRIYAKTASLFCAATEGAAVLSGLPEARIQDLREYGYNLGMAFQIIDDVLDFTSDDDTLGKPAGSDLRQGMLTLPFFYYMQAHPHPAQLVAELEECHELAEEEGSQVWSARVDELVLDLRNSGAIEAARQEAEEFSAKARRNLVQLPANIYQEAMLGLCDFVVQRTY